MKQLPRILATLFISTYLVACNANLTDAEYVARAEKELAEGKTRAALIDLKNALKQNGNNGKARLLLGKVSLEMSDPASAEKELKRARKLGIPDAEVLPLLAEALLQQGKRKELLDLSVVALPPKARAQVMAAQGLAKLAEKENQDAAKLINQALEEAPDSIQGKAARSRLQFMEGKQEEAIQTLQSLLKQHPDYVEGWRLLGNMHLARREYEAAEEAFSQVLKLRPKDLGSKLNRAMARIQQQKFEEAQKDIDAVKKVAPQHGGTNYAQGLIYLGQKKPDDAMAAFEQAVASGGANPLSLYFLAALNLSKGNLEQADNYSQQFLAKFPGNVMGRKLATRIKLKMGQAKAAEELIRPVVVQFEKDTDAINLLASALLKQGKTDESVELFRKAAELKPESAQAQLRLGAGLLIEGEEAKAAQYLQKAAEMNPDNPQADVLLTLSYLKDKNYDQALEVARKYQEKYPDSPAPWNLIGRIHLEAGQREAAVEAFQQALKVEPGDPSALSMLAKLAIDDKDYAKARGYYERILARHKNHLAALVRLSALDALEGREKDMVAHLQRAIDTHPDALQPRLILSRYYLTKGNYDTALTVLGNLNEKQKRNPAVLETLGLIQLGQKKYTQASVTLEQLVEQRPKSAQAHFLLAQAWGGLNKIEKLQRELKKTLELDPDHFQARLARVRLLLLQQKLAEAQHEFQPLKEKHAGQPDVMKLEAALALAQGNKEKAENIYQDVLNKAPSTSTMTALASLKWNLGKQEDAIALQKSWLEKHPEDQAALLALANTLLLAQRIDEMIAAYEELLALDPNNMVALNNLAWYLREKDPMKALQYAEKAHELAPKAAAILDTYAMALLANGRKEKALRQIERAVDAAPKSPTLRLHQAQILAANGRKTEAIGILEELVKGQDFPEKEEAKALLAKLQSG